MLRAREFPCGDWTALAVAKRSPMASRITTEMDSRAISAIWRLPPRMSGATTSSSVVAEIATGPKGPVMLVDPEDREAKDYKPLMFGFLSKPL